MNQPEGSAERVQTIEVDCMHCGSALSFVIAFGLSTLDTNALISNGLWCAKCEKKTPCNKENVRDVEPRSGS